jgi:hypothetical protein
VSAKKKGRSDYTTSEQDQARLAYLGELSVKLLPGHRLTRDLTFLCASDDLGWAAYTRSTRDLVPRSSPSSTASRRKTA